MTLQEFLNLDGGVSFSADDAAALNRELAAKNASDIASSDRQNVLDYLLKAMALNSVEHDIRAKIDELIDDLQAG
ncbi:hypothetical protein [Rhizobium sp. 42MFCr.1]|uniref:hypothetical protein n=1 Tax=Rhizobium sp. 42MFCr.1 TaxID=1048680 RepID=UPI0003643724|nr:hypothetical protein [Rhizobium sp. 42MFCr.1]